MKEKESGVKNNNSLVGSLHPATVGGAGEELEWSEGERQEASSYPNPEDSGHSSACDELRPCLYCLKLTHLLNYFVHYSWFTVCCPSCTVQPSDPVTHLYIHSFSHISLHHAPS